MENKNLLKLSLDDLYKTTKGAARIEKKDEYFNFRRFTESEENYYKNYNGGFFYQRTFATAGVKIDFITDSSILCLKGTMEFVNCRHYYSADIYVDGKFRYSVTNIKNEPICPNIANAEQVYPLSSFDVTLDLKSGDKRIEIFFPWSVEMRLQELSLSENSKIVPAEKRKTVIFYGDSITQGYDCVHMMTHYTFQTAEYLKCDLINKAVGGTWFCPDFIEKTEKDVSAIFVAYGTNDFSSTKKDDFERNCYVFFNRLVSTFSDTPIFAITPIYRICDEELLTKVDFSLDYARGYIKKITNEFDSIKVIDGLKLVEHNEKSFADFRLHPSENGFKVYSDNVIKILTNI